MSLIAAAAEPSLTAPQLWRLLNRTAAAGYTLLGLRGVEAAALTAGMTPEEMAELPVPATCVLTPATNLFKVETGELNNEALRVLAEKNVKFLIVDSYFKIDKEDEKSYPFDGPMPDWLNALISRNCFNVILVQRVAGGEMLLNVEMGDHCFNICDFRAPVADILRCVGAVVLPRAGEDTAAPSSALAFFNDVDSITGAVHTPPAPSAS